jgi:hypothetical protein
LNLPVMGKPSLDQFRRADLEEYPFPGTDAAAVFVAEGTQLSPEVAEVFRRSGQHRWCPAAGGHEVHIPFHFTKEQAHFFKRIERGWDHEHCDFCDASVNIGDRCWTAPSGRGFWIFCGACRAKLPD